MDNSKKCDICKKKHPSWNMNCLTEDQNQQLKEKKTETKMLNRGKQLKLRQLLKENKQLLAQKNGVKKTKENNKSETVQ